MEEKNILEVVEALSGLPTKANIIGKHLSKNEAALISKANQFSANDQKALANKNLKMLDCFIYIAKNIKGATNILELFGNVEKEVGITNIDKGKIEDGENNTIDTIILQGANHSTIDNPAGVSYGDLSNTSGLLQNAELTIWGDNSLLSQIPLSVLLKDDINNANVLKLEKPIFVKAGSNLSAKLEFPKGVAIPTDKEYFFRLILKGVKTTKKV